MKRDGKVVLSLIACLLFSDALCCACRDNSPNETGRCFVLRCIRFYAVTLRNPAAEDMALR